MAHDQETYRRGTAASVVGFFVQLVLAIVMIIIAEAVLTILYQILGI